MAKKKEKVLYTLQDGEVISGVVKYESDKSVIIDLGKGEALLVRSPLEVFETEQEAINEAVEEDFELVGEVFEVVNDELNDIEENINKLFVSQYLLEKSFDRLERSLLTRMEKLESKKWYEFWK